LAYAIIEATEDVSTPIEVDGMLQTITEISTPAALTNTAFTVQRSPDGGTTWLPVFDQFGAALTIAVGTSRSITLDPTTTYALKGLIRLKGAATEAAKRYIGFNGDRLR